MSKGITAAFAFTLAIVACFLCRTAHPPAAYGAESPERASIASVPLTGSERDCKLITGCSKNFNVTLPEIDSEFVLIEVFSMYCPICQGEALKINALHELLQKSPFAQRILLVGAGVDNSRYEVDFFRKKYAIPFALLADPELHFYNACGANGTPYFILAKKNNSGDMEILHTHSGKIASPELFFNTILEKAGLAG